MPSVANLKSQAEHCAANRDFAGGLKLLDQAAEMDRSDADVLVQASYMASLNGEYGRARQYILRAASLRPKSIAVAVEMISRLRAFNLEPQLNSVLSALPPPARLDISNLLRLGAQLSYFNLQERALTYLDEAKRGDPRFPPTLLARAQVLMYLGRIQDAKVDLAAAERIAPQIPKTYWLYSRIRTATPADNRVAVMDRLLSTNDLNTEDRVTLAYALHKELDDLGDHRRAADALEFANRSKRAATQYDSRTTTALVDALMALNWDAMTNASPVEPGKAPVFIVGPHRSGTTLLEQLLDGSDDLLGIGELYDFPSQMRLATDQHCRGPIDLELIRRSVNADFDAVGQGYMNSVQWRLQQQTHFTDKLPTNFFNVGYIRKSLPQAKIVHLVRDPVEVGFSNLRELFGDVNLHTYDQLEMGDYLNDYRRLMAFWHRQFPGAVLDVAYADLTRDPAGTMSKVAEFLGLELTERMTHTNRDQRRAVATASAVQVTEGVISRDVPKWQPYAEYLAPLRGRLAELYLGA